MNDTHGERITRLERTVYTLNGEPGLVEEVHSLQRDVRALSAWVKVAVVLSAATLLTQTPPVAHVLKILLP